MLYIVRSTRLNEWQNQQLQNMSATDSVIFAENGVYCLQYLADKLKSNAFAVGKDCLSRGIESPNATLINYEQWVDLSIQHQHWLNW